MSQLKNKIPLLLIGIFVISTNTFLGDDNQTFAQPATFDGSKVAIPSLVAGTEDYWLDLELISGDPIQFQLGNFGLNYRIQLSSGEGGSVGSQSGLRDCRESESCELDAPGHGGFNDSFTAVPRSGYNFLGWTSGQNYLCGGNIEDCATPNVPPSFDPITLSVSLLPVFEPDGSVYSPSTEQLTVCTLELVDSKEQANCELREFADYGYGELTDFILTTNQIFIDSEQRRSELDLLAEETQNSMCDIDRFGEAVDYATYIPTPSVDPGEGLPWPGIHEPLVFGRIHFALLGDEVAGSMILRILKEWANLGVDLDYQWGVHDFVESVHYQLGLLMPIYVMAWDAIRSADFVSAQDQKIIDDYLHELMVFLAKSPSREASEPYSGYEPHNHAWTQDLGLMAYGVLTGNNSLFQRGIRRYFAILDGLVRSDGSIIHESRRGGSALAYSIGATDTIIRLAELAAVQGYDLYNVEVDGISLQTILEYHMSVLEDETLIHPYAAYVLENPGFCEEQSCIDSWDDQFNSESNPGGYRSDRGWPEIELYRSRFPDSPLVDRYLTLYPEENLRDAEGPFSHACEFRDVNSLIQ